MIRTQNILIILILFKAILSQSSTLFLSQDPNYGCTHYVNLSLGTDTPNIQSFQLNSMGDATYLVSQTCPDTICSSNKNYPVKKFQCVESQGCFNTFDQTEINYNNLNITMQSDVVSIQVSPIDQKDNFALFQDQVKFDLIKTGNGTVEYDKYNDIGLINDDSRYTFFKGTKKFYLSLSVCSDNNPQFEPQLNLEFNQTIANQQSRKNISSLNLNKNGFMFRFVIYDFFSGSVNTVLCSTCQLTFFPQDLFNKLVQVLSQHAKITVENGYIKTNSCVDFPNLVIIGDSGRPFEIDRQYQCFSDNNQDIFFIAGYNGTSVQLGGSFFYSYYVLFDNENGLQIFEKNLKEEASTANLVQYFLKFFIVILFLII